jgi:hypothetical protein
VDGRTRGGKTQSALAKAIKRNRSAQDFHKIRTLPLLQHDLQRRASPIVFPLVHDEHSKNLAFDVLSSYR